LLRHYGGKGRVNVEQLRKEYEDVLSMSVEEATAGSPLFPGAFDGDVVPQKYYDLTSAVYTASGMRADRTIPGEDRVREVLDSMDNQHRWLASHVSISNPYIGDGTLTEPTEKYASTNTGDLTDTSPFNDETDQEYISTRAYINAMRVLMNYVK
jgi:hypothetical protein